MISVLSLGRAIAMYELQGWRKVQVALSISLFCLLSWSCNEARAPNAMTRPKIVQLEVHSLPISLRDCQGVWDSTVQNLRPRLEEGGVTVAKVWSSSIPVLMVRVDGFH